MAQPLKRGRVGGLLMNGVGVVGWPANGEPMAKKSLEESMKTQQQQQKKESESEDSFMKNFAERLYGWLQGEISSEQQSQAAAPAAPAAPAALATSVPVQMQHGQTMQPMAFSLSDEAKRDLAETVKGLVDAQLAPVIEEMDHVKKSIAEIKTGTEETQEGIEVMAKSIAANFQGLIAEVKSIKSHRPAGSDLGSAAPLVPRQKGHNPAAPAGGQAPFVGGEEPSEKVSYKGTAFQRVGQRYFGSAR